MSVFKATTVAALTLLLSNASVQSFQPSSYNGRSCSYTELSLAARRPFISGNWKLNPQTRDEAIQLATDIAASVTDTTPSADIALFVPYVFLESTMNVVQKKLMIGAEVSFLYFLLNVCDCSRWSMCNNRNIKLTFADGCVFTGLYRVYVRKFKVPLPVPFPPVC